MPRLTISFSDAEHATLIQRQSELNCSSLSDTVRQLINANIKAVNEGNNQLDLIHSMLENIHQAIGEVRADIGIKTGKVALASLYSFGLLVSEKDGMNSEMVNTAKAIALEEVKKLK